MKFSSFKLYTAVGTLMALTTSLFAQQATVASQGYYQESDYGKFYIRLGVNVPQGVFGNAFDQTIPLPENISKDGGIGASLGGAVELGRYFFLHEDPISDLFKVGLDATFLSIGYTGGTTPAGSDGDVDEPFDFISAAVKLGPVVSFNVAGDFYTDVFFKVAPTALFSANAPYYFKGSIYDPNAEVLYFETEENVPFALKTDLGINLRYRKVTLTASYESGSFKVPMIYYQNNGSDEVYDVMPQSLEGKMPMGLLQVKLGLQFF